MARKPNAEIRQNASTCRPRRPARVFQSQGRVSQAVRKKSGAELLLERAQHSCAPTSRRMRLEEGELSRGASLRGQGTPADPARLRSVRARNPEKVLSRSRTHGERMASGDYRLAERAREPGTPQRGSEIYLSSSPRRNSYRWSGATPPPAPSSRGWVRCTPRRLMPENSHSRVTVAATQFACSWDLPRNLDAAERLVH